MMKKILLFTAALLASANVIANDTEQALKQVISSFETSINNKDKETFMTLFVEGNVSWVGVFSQVDYENELAWANSEAGQALKRRIGDKFREPAKYRHSSPELFIDSIINNARQPREKIDNVKTISDGEMAIILFDYEFYDGEKKVNYGKESWQLINTGKGWKISAVNYSIARG